MNRALEPWVILARMQRRAARSGVVLPTRRAHAAVDRLRAQAADPLADRVYRQRFETSGPYVCSVCGVVGDRPHALGCAEHDHELASLRSEIAAEVRAAVVADRAEVAARAEQLATDWRLSRVATPDPDERAVASAAASILRAFAFRISRELPAAAVPPALARDAARAMQGAQDALRKVREAARRWVRSADEFDHDLSCTGEVLVDMRAALDAFDRACEDSLVAQAAAHPLPPFEE